MYSRPVARLLWCAPSERKGCGSTLGQQELAMQRSHGSWHSVAEARAAERSAAAAASTQPSDRSTQACTATDLLRACVLHAACDLAPISRKYCDARANT